MMCLEISVDQYCIPLPGGRTQTLSVSQLQRLARGLGHHPATEGPLGQALSIVQALCTLPPEQRADGIAVALLRFGEKQDIETIAHQRHLSFWQVHQLEEGFRAALSCAPAPRPRVHAGVTAEMEEYAESRELYG